MSVYAMSWAWAQKISSNEKIVLVALADRANDDGECWPGYASLADKCSMSERNVIRVVKSLEKNNYIRVEHRKHAESHKQKTNIYHLNMAGGNEQKPGDKLSCGNEQKPGDKCDKSRVTPVSPNTSVNQTKEKTTPRECEREKQKPSPRPEGLLACRLIKQGVAVTGMNPILIQWVKDNIADDLIDQCVALARQQKPLPEKIPARYLDSIIRSELKPKSHSDLSWLLNDAATISKGVELGIEARAGESWQDYRARLKAFVEMGGAA